MFLLRVPKGQNIKTLSNKLHSILKKYYFQIDFFVY